MTLTPTPNPNYMKVYGTHSLQPAVLPHGQSAIVYVPRANVRHTVLEPTPNPNQVACVRHTVLEP